MLKLKAKPKAKREQSKVKLHTAPKIPMRMPTINITVNAGGGNLRPAKQPAMGGFRGRLERFPRGRGGGMQPRYEKASQPVQVLKPDKAITEHDGEIAKLYGKMEALKEQLRASGEPLSYLKRSKAYTEGDGAELLPAQPPPPERPVTYDNGAELLPPPVGAHARVPPPPPRGSASGGGGDHKPAESRDAWMASEYAVTHSTPPPHAMRPPPATAPSRQPTMTRFEDMTLRDLQKELKTAEWLGSGIKAGGRGVNADSLRAEMLAYKRRISLRSST